MKTVLITGAGSGFGRLTAFDLSRLGYRVIAGVQIWSQGWQLRQEIAAAGLDNIEVIKLDLFDEIDVAHALRYDINVLFNNAGIANSGTLTDVPMSRFRENFETNVFAPLALTKAFIRKMAERGSGKIVFNSSDAGLQTPPFGGSYSATKYAVEAIASTLREELRPIGITVATVQPGFYLTGFNDTALEAASYWYDPATAILPGWEPPTPSWGRKTRSPWSTSSSRSSPARSRTTAMCSRRRWSRKPARFKPPSGTSPSNHPHPSRPPYPDLARGRQGAQGENMPSTTEILNALNISRDSTAWQRTVDITTTGARSNKPRRIEIWFHRISGHWYLSSTPARRDWYSNLLAHPDFVFHLKHGIREDLQATGIPITDPAQKRPIFEYIVDDFNQPHNPAIVRQPQQVEDWMAGSPLMEIVFTDIPTPTEYPA